MRDRQIVAVGNITGLRERRFIIFYLNSIYPGEARARVHTRTRTHTHYYVLAWVHRAPYHGRGSSVGIPLLSVASRIPFGRVFLLIFPANRRSAGNRALFCPLGENDVPVMSVSSPAISARSGDKRVKNCIFGRLLITRRRTAVEIEKPIFSIRGNAFAAAPSPDLHLQGP